MERDILFRKEEKYMLDKNTYFALVLENGDEYNVRIGEIVSLNEIKGLIAHKGISRDLFEGYEIGTTKNDKIRDVYVWNHNQNDWDIGLRSRPFRILVWENNSVLNLKTDKYRVVTVKDFYIICEHSKIHDICEECLSDNEEFIKSNKRYRRKTIPNLKQRIKAEEMKKDYEGLSIHGRPLETRQRAKKKAIKKYGDTYLKPWQKGMKHGDKYVPINEDLLITED